MNLNLKKYFLLFFIFTIIIPLQSEGEIIDRVVAIVNDESITLSEVKREALPLIEEAKNRYPLEEQGEKIKHIEAKILDELIKQKLQLQKAKELGITVSEESITAAIEEQKQAYSLTERQFQESLKKEDITTDEYRQKIREQITLITLMNHVVKPKIFFTSKEFKEYYESNLDFFKVPGTIHLQQILIKIPDSKNQVELMNLELTVDKIFNGRKKGERLKDLAEKLEEKGIPTEQLDMGTFKKEELAPQFANVFSLNTGDFTIVKTKSTYHILEVVEKKDDSVRPFSEVKDQIEEILFNKKRDKIYQEYLKELEEASYIEKKNLD